MKKGFTCSAFDLLHSGHILMLKEASEQCDYLICGLHVNPALERPTKTKPVQSIFERYIQLNAVKYVDEIIVYETEQDLKDILECININIRIIGEEYKNTNFSGMNTCKKKGIEIYFNKRRHRFSSSLIRKKVK